MRLYIYIDNDLIPRALKDKDKPETAIDFSEDSVGPALRLVLSQTSEIEKDKVYGPFDVPSYTREKNGLY